jgi:hypothetical protein
MHNHNEFHDFPVEIYGGDCRDTPQHFINHFNIF